MDKDTLIIKIKRLLALAAQNSNAHEAASAQLMAEKIMRKHGITQDDIDLAAIGEIEKTVRVGLKDAAIIHSLCSICMKVFNLSAVTHHRGRSLLSVSFIGPAATLPLVSYVFDFLCRQTLNAKEAYRKLIKAQFKQESDSYIKANFPDFCCLDPKITATLERFVTQHLKHHRRLKVLMRSYLYGYLDAIERNVDDFAARQSKDEHIKEESLIANYKQNHYPKLRQTEIKTVKVDPHALTAGLNDGKTVSLLQPLTGTLQPSLTTGI